MRVVRGKQVSKKGAYYAMWLTSDTKFNEVIRSICLKSDDMQFWLYNYNQIKYFDLDTSSARQTNESWRSILKLCDWNLKWSLTQ